MHDSLTIHRFRVGEGRSQKLVMNFLTGSIRYPCSQFDNEAVVAIVRFSYRESVAIAHGAERAGSAMTLSSEATASSLAAAMLGSTHFDGVVMAGSPAQHGSQMDGAMECAMDGAMNGAMDGATDDECALVDELVKQHFAASSKFVLDATGLTPADAIAAASDVARSDSSAQPCVVCAAKLRGDRAANRKCTCSSGVTVQRDRCVIQYIIGGDGEKRNGNACCDRIKQRAKTVDAGGRAFERFFYDGGHTWSDAWDDLVTSYQAAFKNEDVSALFRFLSSEPFQRAVLEHAVLVDELIHDSLACLIKFGNGLPYSYSPSVAMVFMRCLLDSGARVTGLSAFNLLTPNDTEIGNADFVEIAAEPLYVAAMEGEVEMI